MCSVAAEEDGDARNRCGGEWRVERLAVAHPFAFSFATDDLSTTNERTNDPTNDPQYVRRCTGGVSGGASFSFPFFMPPFLQFPGLIQQWLNPRLRFLFLRGVSWTDGLFLRYGTFGLALQLSTGSVGGLRNS